MRPHGKVNLVGLVILGGLAYGVWWAVTYVPARMDHLDVQEAVKSTYNAARGGNELELQTRATLLAKLNDKTLGWHMAEDESGNLVRKPGLGIKDEQITLVRDEVTNLYTVTVEYDRLIFLKPFNKQELKHFVATYSGPIK